MTGWTIVWHISTHSVRTSCHFARFTLDSDHSPHILYSTHSTLCNYNYTSLSSSAVTVQQLLPSRCMDPTTAHQQPSPGSELALSSNSAGQTINVANGLGDSDERIPSSVHPTTMRQSTMTLLNLRYRASQRKTLGLRTRGWAWACPLYQRTLVRATHSWCTEGSWATSSGGQWPSHPRPPLEPCKSPPCRRQRFRTELTSLEEPTTQRTRTSQDSGASPRTWTRSTTTGTWPASTPCKPFGSSERTRTQMLISRSGSSMGPPPAQPEGPRVTRRRSRLHPPNPAMVCAPSLSMEPSRRSMEPSSAWNRCVSTERLWPHNKQSSASR